MKLTATLSLPPDTVCRTLALLAQKGTGKTYTALKLAELLHAEKAQFVFLDPTGVAWGLRAGPDGTDHAGLPVLIMGGNHGDLPLEPAAGEIVAQFIVESGRSVVLDLSLFESKAAQNRFATALALKLYRLKAPAERRTPLHLFLDEADQFVPQHVGKAEAPMVGAFETIVRLGRSRGFGITMISQRAAVVNKNVLEQVDALLCHRTTGDIDIKKMLQWTQRYLHDRKQIQDFEKSLPQLAIGEVWFWSPGWLSTCKRGQVLPRHTYDSSHTPEPGKALPEVKLASVDLEGLSAQILASAERAKESDPKALQETLQKLKLEKQRADAQIMKLLPMAERVKALEQQLAEAAEPEPVEVSVLTAEDRELISTLRSKLDLVLITMDSETISNVQRLLMRIPTDLSQQNRSIHLAARPKALLATAYQSGEQEAVESRWHGKGQVEAMSEAATSKPVNPESWEQRILNVCADLARRGITANSETVAAWLDCHRQTKSFVKALADLRAQGHLDGFTVQGNCATDPIGGLEGVRCALMARPSTSALFDRILNLEQPVSQAELADLIPCHRQTKSFVRGLAHLRAMGVIPASGPIHPLPCILE